MVIQEAEMAKAVSKKSSTHTLQDDEQIEAIIKRIKRAQGQLGAVARMIQEGRSCDEVVTQISAASKAINSAAFTLISASLEECIIAGKSNQSEVTEKLQKLFLTLA
jgi:DNA-binding FrmR family transcriptional regulator